MRTKSEHFKYFSMNCNLIVGIHSLELHPSARHNLQLLSRLVKANSAEKVDSICMVSANIPCADENLGIISAYLSKVLDLSIDECYNIYYNDFIGNCKDIEQFAPNIQFESFVYNYNFDLYRQRPASVSSFGANKDFIYNPCGRSIFDYLISNDNTLILTDLKINVDIESLEKFHVPLTIIDHAFFITESVLTDTSKFLSLIKYLFIPVDHSNLKYNHIYFPVGNNEVKTDIFLREGEFYSSILGIKKDIYNPLNPEDPMMDDGDCVIRTLCIMSSNHNWSEVYKVSANIGAELKCIVGNSPKAMIRTLSTLNPEYTANVMEGIKEETVGEFMYRHKSGKYIISSTYHMAGYMDGVWYDNKFRLTYENNFLLSPIDFVIEVTGGNEE